MSASARPEIVPALQGRVSSDTGTFRAARSPNKSSEVETDAHRADPPRQHAHLSKIIRRIRQLRPLREDALNSQIVRREKMRQMAFKRDRVSTCDSNLMGQLQALFAQGKLDDYPDLLKLYNQCQEARDTLGPLEKEAIDAEQTTEWKWSKVEKVEDPLYNSLFGLSENLPSISSSSSLHDFESASEHDSFEFDDESIQNTDDGEYRLIQPYLPSTLPSSSPPSPTHDIPEYENTVSQFSFDSDMILNDGKDSSSKSTPNNSQAYDSTSQSPSVIDHRLDSQPDEYLIPEYPTSQSGLTNLDFNPWLLRDFTSIRDRVGKWLLQKLLLSRLEAKFLKLRLDAENPKAPSNWAQLVLAWWDKDAAASPSHSHTVLDEKSKHQNDPSLNLGRLKSSSDPITRGRGWDSQLPPWSSHTRQMTSPKPAYSKESIRSGSKSGPLLIPATLRAKERFVLLLFEHEPLRALFEGAKMSLQRKEFPHALSFPLGRLLNDLLWEAKKPSDRDLVTHFMKDFQEIALMIEVKVYGPRSENLPPSRLPAEDFLISDRLNLEVSTKSNIQLKSSLDSFDVTNSSELPENFQEFVLQSKAFRTFYSTCAEDFNFQDEPTLLESDISSTPLPHDNSSSLDQHILPDSPLDLQSRTISDANPSQPVGNLSVDGQLLNAPVLLDQNIDPHNTDECNVVQSEPEETVPSDSAHPTEELERVQTNSAWKRETDATNTQSQLPSGQIRNGMKKQNQSYSAALNQGLEAVKVGGLPGKTDSAPFWLRPKLLPRVRTDPVLENQKGEVQRKLEKYDIEDEDNGVKTPTPSNTRTAKSEAPRIFSQQGSATTSQAATVTSESSKGFWGLERPWLERSDKSLKQHERGDFSWGKVFKLYWSGPQGDNGEFDTVISLQKRHGFRPKLLRFVIIGKKEKHCECLAIMTYNGRGTAKAGVKADDHAIIYTSTPRLVEGESNLKKQPIRIETFGPQHQLDIASRINYSKIYHVKYDVKLCFIGKVESNSERVLEETCKEAHLPIQPRTMPPQPPPIAVKTSYAKVAALDPRQPDSPTTAQSSIRSWSSISGRGPRSQSTQSSVFPLTSTFPAPTRKSRFTMSPPKAMWTKGIVSASPTRLSENKNPEDRTYGRNK